MISESLTIKKLKCGSNLKKGFELLSNNNTIDFSNRGIAIVYGPNGTGKTSISRIFLNEKGTEAEIEYKRKIYTDFEKTPLFHVIRDQNNRNIIEGETDEFILGDNIQKERMKKEELNQAQQTLFDSMKDKLKKTFLITKKTAVFVESITNGTLKAFVETLSKTGSKASDLEYEKLISLFKDKQKHSIPSYSDEQLNYFRNDVCKTNEESIIYAILKIKIEKIEPNAAVRIIGRNTDAISILKRYQDIHQCIVCDTPNINPEALLGSKEIESEKVRLTLNSETRKILEGIIQKIEYHNDPFNLVEILSNAIETGEAQIIIDLVTLIGGYQEIEEHLLENDLLEIFTQSTIQKIYEEYNNMFISKIMLTGDDELLIDHIISESMGKKIELIRDEEKNIIIRFEGKNLLGESRDSLPLSAGEQNFISLSFELLKAKNDKEAPIIVLDDPISSFDSIFKNKIAYCIVKFLEKKRVLIFTHNIDLIRLLDVQIRNCFNFYLLCNDTDNKCGFIHVDKNERENLLYLDKLLQFFRGKMIEHEIIDRKLYLMSLLPFMRGIIKIVNPKNQEYYNKQLSEIMHGCNTSPIDVAPIYNVLFEKEEQSQILAPDDLLTMDVENLAFFKESSYPLLSKTLKHTLTYLYLRLRVENTLKKTFPDKTKGCNTLGEYISSALDKHDFHEERARLSSMKTLLNEFNHCEGNFSIFQPAIDISDESLAQEKQRIELTLKDIENKAKSL